MRHSLFRFLCGGSVATSLFILLTACGTPDPSPLSSKKSALTLCPNRLPGGNCVTCIPKQEECNGLDDDCDGIVDNNLFLRFCTNACGFGTRRCEQGSWTRCSAGQNNPEICNGRDDNCDGQIDEGVTRTCSSLCGQGIQTCSAGDWGPCSARVPKEESCNRIDDDCDGRVDEGLSDVPEVCNGKDDNCNGQIDEGASASCGFLKACRFSMCLPRCLAGECPRFSVCSYAHSVCLPTNLPCNFNLPKKLCPFGMTCNKKTSLCEP